MMKRVRAALAAAAVAAMAGAATMAAVCPSVAIGAPVAKEPLDVATIYGLRERFKQLIDAENRHDLASVRSFVWTSPSTLFVGTMPAAEGNGAGIWGTDGVMRHLGELYKGTFRMEPDYAKVRVVGLTRDVAETYAPLKITTGYAGQTPLPKPLLMIVAWIRTSDGWKVATNIALPVSPPSGHD